MAGSQNLCSTKLTPEEINAQQQALLFYPVVRSRTQNSVKTLFNSKASPFGTAIM